MKVYNFDNLCQWLYNYQDFIDYVKATNIKKIGFNTLEGSRYIVNVKIITNEGYKNKLLQTYINSTYLDDIITEITNDCINECLNSYIMR
jgi:hypothetical protein